MPYFKDLGTHRRSVISLYRTLLRHIRHTNEIPKFPPGLPKLLLKSVRNAFKSQKSQMSPNVVRSKLEKGYELEEKLREAHLELEPKSFVSIQSLITKTSESKTSKEHVKPLRTRTKQLLKLDTSNIQPLVRQQMTNYLDRYIKSQQRMGNLPYQINPSIKDTILLDQALFERAQLDVRRAIRRNSNGPYKVHISRNSAKIKFVRSHLPQSKKVQHVISAFVKREQELFDLINYWKDHKYQYEMENIWEESIGSKGDWGNDIIELITKKEVQIEKWRRYFKHHQEVKLPLIASKRQISSNEMHLKSQKRLADLLKEVKNATPFDNLLQKPSLRDIVAKYKFQS